MEDIIYIARDSGKNGEEVWIFTEKPIYIKTPKGTLWLQDDDNDDPIGEAYHIDKEAFPYVLPGECCRFKVSLISTRVV